MAEARRAVPRSAALVALPLALSLACAGLNVLQQSPPPATLTPNPTPPATGTATLIPTKTRRPTSTPNYEATQQASDFDALLSDLQARGVVSPSDGEIVSIGAFEEELADQTWFWLRSRTVQNDFVFSADFEWSTATDAMGVSGCGVAFGVVEEDFGYAVFLDDTRLQMLGFDRSGGVILEPLEGTDRFNYGNPAKAHFVLAVRDRNAYVAVDGKVAHYRLSGEHDGRGGFGRAVLSATTRGYGTRCTMRGSKLWIAQGH